MGLKLPPRVVAVPCREIGNGEKLEGTKERREGGFIITFFFYAKLITKVVREDSQVGFSSSFSSSWLAGK